MTVDEYAPCWWCREPFPRSELVHLEGARMLGSEPLTLGPRLSPDERAAIVVCRVLPTGVMQGCVAAFVKARHRRDVELAEYGGNTRSFVETLALLVDQDPGQIVTIERIHGRSVADAVRTYLRHRQEDQA